MSILIENLTKQYGTQLAIDNLSFEVKKGEILGFLGPNGAGKSTTMKIITCYLSPTSGTVKLDGLDVTNNSIEVRKKIGYLPENNPLYLDMYVHEFLDFVAGLYNIPSKIRKERVAQMIEITGLSPEQHKKIGSLSKGYKQRVGLAQAIIHDPEVLILDEPTTGLDPNQIIEIRNLIKDLGKNKTIIFSTHILSEVEAIADKVIIINKGKIILNDSKANVQQKASGEQLILLEFEKSAFDFTSIKSLEGVIGVDDLGENKFRIRTQNNTDIRKIVYEESIKQGNSILSLNKEEYSLEDVFRKLTQ